MSSAEVKQSLIGAMHFDSATMSHRHLRQYVPNSAHIIALLVGLGVRVSELVQLRWQHFNLEHLFVTVPQSKIVLDENGRPNKEPVRIVPLHESLVPWLRALMELYGMSSTKGCMPFVVQLTWPKVHGLQPTSEDSVIGRMNRVLKHAGTKLPGKSTHFGRATHVSMATMAPGLEPHMIKAFVGHAAFDGTETDRYFKLRREHLRPMHRRYLHLASPDAVRRAARKFKAADDAP